MSATGLAEVSDTDCLEIKFSSFYDQKNFTTDWIRLRDLARKQARGGELNEAERSEVATLRTRIRRVDGDSVLLLLFTRRGSGFNYL